MNDLATAPGAALSLAQYRRLGVRQKHELGELFGFETRNKYEIADETGTPVGYAAEQQKGFLGFLLRQFFGHWRNFEIHFFTATRAPFFVATHPFRFLFQRLEVAATNGRPLGAVQQRFSLLTKRFDIQNARGQVVMEVASPIWKIWTFLFMSQDRQVASVKKKWSGLFSEAFTDKDNFLVEFDDAGLSEDERCLVLAAAVFIDLQYFERKAR